MSIFSLAEIIQNIKVYICLNREFCQLFKKKKKIISIGPVVFCQEIKKKSSFLVWEKKMSRYVDEIAPTSNF